MNIIQNTSTKIEVIILSFYLVAQLYRPSLYLPVLTTSKYLRISDISLIKSEELTGITAQIRRTYKIESADVHRLDFETEFILSKKYGIEPLGTVTGQAGAVISGVERDSRELVLKALEIAQALHVAIVDTINKHQHNVNFELFDCPAYLPHIFTYLQMQNEGIGGVGFDVWGKVE